MLTKKDIEDVRTVIFVGEERAYEDVVAELRRLAMAGLEADALRERAEKAEREIERLRSDAKTLAAEHFAADYRAAIARADKAEDERDEAREDITELRAILHDHERMLNEATARARRGERELVRGRGRVMGGSVMNQDDKGPPEGFIRVTSYVLVGEDGTWIVWENDQSTRTPIDESYVPSWEAWRAKATRVNFSVDVPLPSTVTCKGEVQP